MVKKRGLLLFYFCIFIEIFAISGNFNDNSDKDKFIYKISEILPKDIFEHLNKNRSLFFSDFKSCMLSTDKELFMLVDKKHKISKDYSPKKIVLLSKIKNKAYVVNRKNIALSDIVLESLQNMSKIAKQAGVTLVVSSGYRPYRYQNGLFNHYVKKYGKLNAEKFSARPGTSQHQLGTTVDFGSIDDNFATTKPGQWLKDNASKYGWSLSYPKGFEEVTGYKWECWHYRFLGVEACKLQDKWFDGVQQYMLECIHCWNNLTSF